MTAPQEKNVTIIGTGHSGMAMAASLRQKGFAVCLYAHPDHDSRWQAIRKNGVLKSTGVIEGTWTIDLMTRDISRAVAFSDNIILALPSYAQDDMFALLRPCIRDTHRIVNLNGNLSSYALAHNLKSKKPVIVETNSAPQASRADHAGCVAIMGEKKFIPIAPAEPGISETSKKAIADLFKCDLEWQDSIIAVALQAYNGVLHPAPTLLNAGWAEAQNRDFLFYKEGLSPSVGKIVDSIDKERLEIARRYGYTHLRTTLQALQGIYGGQYSLISEFARNAAVYGTIKASNDMKNRYLTEDVPFVLVPWYALGKAAGFEAQAIRSVICLASLMHDTDYMKTGRTLDGIPLPPLQKTAQNTLHNGVNTNKGYLLQPALSCHA